jgi:hypothetical protein
MLSRHKHHARVIPAMQHTATQHESYRGFGNFFSGSGKNLKIVGKLWGKIVNHKLRATTLSVNVLTRASAKHIDIRKHYAHEAIQLGHLRLVLVATADQLADVVLFKGLQPFQHCACILAIQKRPAASMAIVGTVLLTRETLRSCWLS